jgi:uncharacterized protein YkwD
MIKYYLLSISLVVCALASMAQSATDKIYPNSFNTRLYEKTLHAKINEYRAEKGLNPLFANVIIYKVANDHCTFLKTKAELTHDQPTAGKQTVEDRLKLYTSASTYEVGENIARTFVLKPTYNYERDGSTKLSTATTYDQAATYMLNAWIQSDFHRNNILNSTFELSGLAVYYNPVNQSLTAVQVFAKIG